MLNLKPIYINISGYRFTPIAELDKTLDQLKSLVADLDIKGSLYLAEEGLNIGVAGNILAVQTFRNRLDRIKLFAGMRFHELYSQAMPYKKMTVKTKTELVPIEDRSLKVGDFNHQYLSAMRLKAWLDAGKDFVLLDMRNDFEYQLGTFDQAQHLNLKRFRKLRGKQAQIEQLPKDKPIVTFCTGGIRCEKAGPYLEKFGRRQIYQLQGGIIEYLRQTQGAHWHGHCFVFDERVTVTKDLAPQHFDLCTDCQCILKAPEVEFCQACLAAKQPQNASV